MILQIIPGTESLVEKYGLWGLVFLVGVGVIRYLLKRQAAYEAKQAAYEARNQAQHEEQSKKFDKYLEEDRKEVLHALEKSNTVVEKCTEALENNSKVMEKLTTVMDTRQRGSR